VTNSERDRIINILREILFVDDIEIKDCAIESLIDMLQDLETKDMNEKIDGD